GRALLSSHARIAHLSRSHIGRTGQPLDQSSLLIDHDQKSGVAAIARGRLKLANQGRCGRDPPGYVVAKEDDGADSARSDCRQHRAGWDAPSEPADNQLAERLRKVELGGSADGLASWQWG